MHCGNLSPISIPTGFPQGLDTIKMIMDCIMHCGNLSPISIPTGFPQGLDKIKMIT